MGSKLSLRSGRGRRGYLRLASSSADRRSAPAAMFSATCSVICIQTLDDRAGLMQAPSKDFGSTAWSSSSSRVPFLWRPTT